MDEQRLTARIAALRLAFQDFPMASEIEGRYRVAGAFENWLMRPEPIDVSGVNERPGRQPCGAFLRPPWFIGRVWLTCSGAHREGDSWHIADGGSGTTVFHSHHAPNHAGPEMCACGGTALPCPNADPKDMRK
jgi:hypothetical protein